MTDGLVRRLWTYRYWHPFYRSRVTLDCVATSPEQALERARRWVRRENAGFRRLRIPWFIPVPTRVAQLRKEGW